MGWKGFPAFPAHLRMRPVSRGNSRRATCPVETRDSRRNASKSTWFTRHPKIPSHPAPHDWRRQQPTRLPRGVRPRLEGRPRTPLSSRVATRVSWSPLSLRELLRVPLRSQGYCGAGTPLSGLHWVSCNGRSNVGVYDIVPEVSETIFSSFHSFSLLFLGPL